MQAEIMKVENKIGVAKGELRLGARGEQKNEMALSITEKK